MTATVPADSQHSAPSWTAWSERGSTRLLRFMAWLSLRMGRASVRTLVYLTAAYFLATSGAARIASRAFLSRALGRRPTLAERYCHFLSFASTIHDRMFFASGDFAPFDIRVHGTAALDSLPDGTGAFLMGGHLGSFDAIRACGRIRTHRPVYMAMYEEHARKLNAVLGAINPRAIEGIVPLGHMQSMLKLRELLDAGSMVGILADRTPGREPVLSVPFFGEPASFPTGPMRLAAILHCPVIFMVGLYAGANRYDIHFETLADFSRTLDVPRAERDRLVADAVTRYAGRMEHFARLHPDNWFNFHDFWSAPPAP